MSIKNSILILICSIIIGCQLKKQPRKIEILFLGHDSRHPNSEKYMPILASALATKGINFTYTSSPESLTSENLALFDGLMIYANHDNITKNQEKALLDFVAGGKGFLPIHSASFCFQNSEQYIDLVGAQLKSHETGTFSAEIVNREHPITQDLETFESWDETYVHAKHNPDRTILMERVEGDTREPWTWVREQDKGRVFYTASGHDERTWTNPGFQQLLLNGILWTVGDERKGLWEQLVFEPLQYTPSENIANYERRPKPLPLQVPLAQPESQKYIQVPPEFNLKVFAAEPNIINPMALNWDERGRLWVIEGVDYPNEVREENKGNDRIKICEDTNGDGRADKFTIFADSLNLPTSLVFANGGVIVSMAPNFIYFKDTDGDDRADVRETIFTGWGTFDTHAGPSNLKYGFDNYVWGTVGYSGVKGTLGNKTIDFGQAFYRFKVDGTDFEHMAKTSNNTWGLGFSETFDVFGSTANNAHSWYMAIPLRYFDGVEGIPGVGSKKIADYYAFHPITENVRQVDVFGGFTAAAGHNLYTARSFPKEYWNQIALVCEPTGHLLAKGKLEKAGAGFVLKDRWNLLVGADEWVAPVHAEVGPDGAVWVADWYDFIIQHNPTPTPERGGYQAETGKGNAHVNPLRDKKYGRIYRVVFKDAPRYIPIKLSKDDRRGLIKALSNDNLFWRLTAQRLLVERGDQDVFDDLMKLISNTEIDEIGLNGAAVHALWTIQCLGGFSGNNQEANDVAIKALKHPAAGVRKAAMQVLPKTIWTRQALLDADVLNDPDPYTRLVALLIISDMPTDIDTGKALYEISKSNEIAEDLWLSQALFIAANKHKTGFITSYETDTEAVTYQKVTEAAEAIPRIWDKWDEPEKVTSNWQKLIPGKPWEETVLPDFNGMVIAYRGFTLNKILYQAVLHLGRIGQTDYSFVNGKMLQETRNDPEMLRVSEIPPNTLQLGQNYVLIRIEDNKGPGGLLGPGEEMYLQAGNDRIALDGEWKYAIQSNYGRGINYSDFKNGRDLAARFVTYNTGESEEMESGSEKANPNAVQLDIQSVKNEMKFSTNELTVEAGKLVELTIQNTDFLQHNFLLLIPGSLERVGAAADILAQQSNGLERQYIPDMPEILVSSKLIDPNGKETLSFSAPLEPGDYPFVCTFPGHWRTMNGILKVI